MSVAMAPTMDTLAMVEGINGPMMTPDPSRARTCPLKVGGQTRMIQSATLASSPLFVTAAPIPMAAISSQTVVPEKLPNAVVNGTIPKRTHVQHMMKMHTKSGIALVIQLIIAQINRPIVHIAFCSSPPGAGIRAMPRPTAMATASLISFFFVSFVMIKVPLPSKNE